MQGSRTSITFAVLILLALLIPQPAAAQDLNSVLKQAESAVKLPAAVTRRLKMIDTSLDKADKICARDLATLKSEHIQTAQSSVTEAQETYDGLMKDYGSKITPGHPEVKAREDHIAATKQKTQDLATKWAANQQAAGQTATATKASAEEWLKKLRMYAAGPGNSDYDKDHSLVISPSQDPAELDRQRKLFAEASAVLEQSKKMNFPGGKSDEIAQAERDMEFHLKGLSESVGAVSGEAIERAEEQLAQADRQLATQETNTDPAYIPNPLRKGWIDELKSLVDQATASAAGNPTVESMPRKLADIQKRDAAIRELRRSRIIMKSDKFTGPELGDVKSKAAELVLKDHADAKVLSATVISSDWKEESVVESTDTTNTALRHRVTRAVTAQVAAKIGDAVTLYTVYVAADKRTDGTWSALYGNVMYSDAMLEKNIVSP